MKLFITGSDGFIGKELISQCKNLGIEVIGVDVRSGFDVRSKDIAEQIPKGIDAVIHLAGLSSDIQCKNKGYETVDINVLGTLNLMEAATARKAKQFIFASSEWAYDNCAANEQKTEESIINIANHTSEYALSKLVSEANLRQKYQNGFCPVTILRFGIVFGTTGEKKSAVESLYLNVKEKDEISVGSLKNGRCFIHVSDIASGIIKSVSLQGFNIINLAGDKLITLQNIIEASKKVLNKNPRVIETSPENVSIRNISNSKAKLMLNWSPTVTIESWLRKLTIGKKIDGLWEITPETYQDERGFLARIYDEKMFKDLGFDAKWMEVSHHHTSRKNILRGLYTQLPPFSEGKLLRIIKGEMLWVSVDLRKESKTFGQWESVVLSEKNKNVLVTARGFAHGCLSLTDNVDLLIQSDNYFSVDHGVGIAWNDPELNIDWELNGIMPYISERDSKYPSFKEFKEKYGGI